MRWSIQEALVTAYLCWRLFSTLNRGTSSFIPFSNIIYGVFNISYIGILERSVLWKTPIMIDSLDATVWRSWGNKVSAESINLNIDESVISLRHYGQRCIPYAFVRYFKHDSWIAWFGWPQSDIETFPSRVKRQIQHISSHESTSGVNGSEWTDIVYLRMRSC